MWKILLICFSILFVSHKSAFSRNIDGESRELIEGKGTNSELKKYQKLINEIFPGAGDKKLHKIESLGLELALEGSIKINEEIAGELKQIPIIALRFQKVEKIGTISWVKNLSLMSISFDQCGGISNLAIFKSQDLRVVLFKKCDLSDLSFSANTEVAHLQIFKCSGIKNLSILRNLSLNNFSLNGFKNMDLSVLSKYSFESLSLWDCQDSKYPFLKNLDTESLSVSGFKALTSLDFMESLKSLKYLSVIDCENLKDLSNFRKSTVLYLKISGCPKINELSWIEDSKVLRLKISLNNVEDLSPLQKVNLKELDFRGCSGVKDFSPLKKMKTLVEINGKKIKEFWDQNSRKKESGKL